MKTAVPFAVLAMSLGLAACATKRIDPPPSPAILEARAKAQAAKGKAPERCGLYTFVTSAPVRVPFPYNRAELSETEREQLTRAAVWLNCNPAVWATINGQDDAQGTPEARRALANARVAAVRTALVTAGVHPDRILAYKPTSAATLVLEARGRGW
ncbi:OmpA family protein [Phenylobacterium sp.]|jgi:outer membrane protein OmpA-like peptidoglycan-associated protein|uniref:OmpA family protein n=1 Tax=Phenylobacterium sp. TaxID=1871053 RepID=UPI002F936E29